MLESNASPVEAQKREFKEGGLVLVKVENRQKGSDRYEGPLQISCRVHDRSFELKNKTGRVIYRNIEWLKPFKAGGVRIINNYIFIN